MKSPPPALQGVLAALLMDGAVSVTALTDHVKYKKDMNYVPRRQQSTGNETRASVREVNLVWPFDTEIMASNARFRQPNLIHLITDKFIVVIITSFFILWNCTVVMNLKS